MSMPMLLAVALIVIVALALLWHFSQREKPAPWIQTTSCPNCSWKGHTSRYAGRCPECNTPIGDQRVNRRQ